MAVSKNKRNKNAEGGFVPIRRGIYEHLSDGRMTGKELMVYTTLHLKADHLTGICYKVSGVALGLLLKESTNYINRVMRSLERKGYIKRISHRGQIKYYPVVINKYYTSNGILINARNTKSLNEIAWYVEEDCTLTAFQQHINCTSNALQMHTLQEVKNITILIKGKNSGGKKPPSPEFKLSSLLLDLILQRKPDYREGQPNCKDATLQRWTGHIDKMVRIDNRKPDRIEAVIRWCQADSGSGNGKWKGWQDNILSTAKLREKFDKLELAMQKGKNDGSSSNRGHNSGSTEPFIR